MAPESVPDPAVVERIDLEPEPPTPRDCLPPGEELLETADLDPGWIAVTERELLSYHPDRDPALVRVPRPNLTGLEVRRAGGRRFLGYVPTALLYAVGAAVVGLVLLRADPTGLVPAADAPGADSVSSITGALAWAADLLGAVLVFSAILAGLVVVTVVGYWLFSRRVALVVERGGADPIECPTTKVTGKRAVTTLEDAFAGPSGDP
jgi:hypothetical protein